MWWRWQVPGTRMSLSSEPAGRLDAVVKRRGEETQAAQTPASVLLIDAYRFPRSRVCKHAARDAHDGAQDMRSEIMLFLLPCDRNTQRKCTHIYTQPGESFGSPWQLCPELPIRLRELQTPSAITLSCWLHLHNIIEKATGALSLKVKM